MVIGLLYSAKYLSGALKKTKTKCIYIHSRICDVINDLFSVVDA